jgi:myxalamid-type polyketide synthase MxaE and MxaD
MNAREPREPLAIVGIGCRFPGASGPHAFWNLLCDSKDVIGPIPPNRWDREAFFDADPTARGKMVARTGGFLDDIEGFDWRAFRISPREAKFMDPQHRLLLEVAWEAIEDAGIPFERIAGTKTAVFVGIMWNDYGKLQALDLERLDGYSAAGNAFAFAANRVSFFFDLKGPSVALDVSCASSLMAVHLAAESVWSGETDMALAGGVNLIISPDSVIAMSKAGILSAEGHCKPFDAAADGFVRGEGAGLIVLKRLSRALTDGDRIYATLRGSATMHSGKTDWIMAPSRAAQEEVYREAYRRAGVDPRDVDYVELHGTGTRKGDPLEAASVGNVIGRGSGRTTPCIVGSVKTNIGHLDSAAGIAGLIKTALAIRHRRIPGSLNLEHVNPEIDLEALGLDFQTEPRPWPDKHGSLLAAVTGLSFGGANVHVVLEEAPPRTDSVRLHDARARPPFILPISARSEGALRELAGAYSRHLASEATDAGAICAAAALRRSHHSNRIAIVGRSGKELSQALDALAHTKKESAPSPGAARVAFVFSGQGPQWWAMGRELLEQPGVFLDAITACDGALREHAGFSVLEELRRDEQNTRVHETRIAQPAIFAVQVALAQLLASWGIAPSAIVGHSVGEIAAAHVSGALSLEDAARVAAIRGRIMHAATNLGGMAQVALSREEADALVAPFGDRLGVAADNGPRHVVLSGAADAIQEATRLLRGRGVVVRPLGVPYAFHSSVMARFQDELGAALSSIVARPPSTPIASSLFGRLSMGGDAFSSEYWVRQMREPVEFRRAIVALDKEGLGTYLELSPHPVLASSILETLGGKKEGAVVPTLVRGEPERAQLLAALAILYARGSSLDWGMVFDRSRATATLPSYPFQRERLWIDSGPMQAATPEAPPSRTAPSHPLLEVSTDLARPRGAHVWEVVLAPERFAYLDDHKVAGKTVVPASLYVEMAIAAAAQAGLASRCQITELELRRALVLPSGKNIRLQLSATPDEGGRFRLEFHGRPEGSHDAFTLHASAILSEDTREDVASASFELNEETETARESDEIYDAFRRSGEDYGPAFQGITRLFRQGEHDVCAEIDARAKIASDADHYFFHPAMLDACMHAMAAARVQDGEAGFMPVRIDRIRILGLGTRHLFTRASLEPGDGSEGLSRANVTVFDERKQPVMEIQGISLQYLDALGREPGDTADCYSVEWRHLERPRAASGASDDARPLLVVAHAGRLGPALLQALSTRGRAGDLVFRSGDPTARVAAALSSSGYAGIVYVADFGTHGGERASDRARKASLDVINLVKLLGTLPEATAPRLFLVTRDAQPVAGTTVVPEAAALWGLGRSIASEHADLWGGLIDVDEHADGEEIASLICDRGAADGVEEQLVVRGGSALAARLVPFRAATEAEAPLRLRDDASYLVTGGLGALGTVVARWLAKSGAKHLILLSRRGVSPAHATAVSELAALGAQVHPVAADVADEERLRAALRELAGKGVPQVAGVFHAAGAVALSPITELRPEDLDAIYRSKVDGTEVLDRVFAGAALDYFVLFSSASAILGSPSLGAYAAANAFMDGVAHARRARGQVALSVNWGPWAGEGMAQETGASRGPLRLRGMGAILPERGAALLETFLTAGLTQISVLPIDFGVFRAAYSSFAKSPFLSELSGGAPSSAPAPSSHPAASVLREAVTEDRRERVEEYLLTRAAVALQAPPGSLDAESSLIELGLDSLMLVELRLEIERSLGIRLPLMDLLSDPSIRELSKSLDAKILELT